MRTNQILQTESCRLKVGNLSILAGALATLSLIAGNAAIEPWQRWLRDPATVPLQLEVSAWAGSNVAYNITLATTTAAYYGVDCVTETQTNSFTERLKPHQNYQLTVDSTQIERIKIDFKPFIKQQELEAAGEGAFPRVYKVFIDREEKDQIDHAFGSCGAYTNKWNVEIRPDHGLRPISLSGVEDHWARDDDSPEGAAPGDGNWAEIGPGKDADASKGAFRWSVSMGRLWNGNAAGRIRLLESRLTTAVYNGQPLAYTPRSTSTTELTVITNSNGTLRQIRAPQALADIQGTNEQCNLKFYLLSQVGSTTNGNGLFPINDDNPFVIWRHKNPDSSGVTNRLHIIEERAGVTNFTEIQYDSTNTIWSIKTGGGSEQRVETRAVSISGSNRIETAEIKTPTTNIVYKAIETYRQYPWGWELTNVVTDPGGASLTNSFVFNTDPSYPLDYKKVSVVWHPGGAWEKREYDQENNPGLLGRVYRPWKDAPADPASATVTNCWLTTYGYGFFSDHVNTYVTQSYGDSEIETNWTRLRSETDYDLGSVREETQVEPNQYGTFYVTKNYVEPGTYLADLLYSVKFTDDRKQSYLHQRGTYNPTNLTFQVDSTNASAFRTIVVYGSAVDSAISMATLEDESIDPLFVHPGKTTKEVIVRVNGNDILREKYAFKQYAPGSTNEFVFELIDRKTMAYDSLGHLTNVVRIDPKNTNITRTVYSAAWKSSGGQDWDLKSFEIDDMGIRTDYNYDTLKRTKTITNVGNPSTNGFPAQADIVQTISYDPYGRTLTNIVSGGGLSLTNRYTYDKAGRVLTETDPAGLTTSRAYSNWGLTETITLPGGATNVINKYLDGRLKSITGTAQVNEFHDYAVTDISTPQNAGGGPRNIEEIRYATNNSPRWIQKITDLRGYPSQDVEPSFYYGGTNLAVVTNYLTYSHDLLAREDRMGQETDSGTFLLYKKYEYDEYGNRIREGVSTNGGWFEVASTDRIQTSETFYETDGTNWFLVTTNRTYLTDGSDTPTQVSITKERLTGYSSTNAQKEIGQYDFNTNLTTVITYVDRSFKRVTTVTASPNSSLYATNIVVNGLLQTEGTTSVAAQTQYRYDGLARSTQTISPLGFIESTAYDSANGRVISTTDFTGSTTTLEYYPSSHLNAGRLKGRTAANGKRTYYEYNSRGQLTRTWGEGPYPEERVYNNYGDLTELRTFRDGSGWSGSSWPGTGTPDTTRWSYQETTGLLTNKSDALDRAVTFSYYTNNMLKTRAYARGVTTTNFYNLYLDLERLDYSDSTSDVTYTNYNRAGFPRRAIDGTGTNDLAYDHANRLTTVTGVSGVYNGVTISNRYDKVFGRDRVKVSGVSPAVTNDYRYDASSGRLNVVSNGVYSATYGYLPNSDLLQTSTFRNNGTTKLTTTRSWEFGGRLRSIANAAGTATISSHAYNYDNVNRRTRSTLEDNSAWVFDYNDRNELISGKRVWADQSQVSGQQFEYTYDNIGNRINAKSGGDVNGANLRTNAYTGNSLNQYTQVTAPGYEDILGVAWATAAVTVDSGATDRKGEYYHREITISNGSGPLWQTVTLNPAPPIETSTNLLFPDDQQTLTYDLDGNLTFDGIWSYAWDAENRLKEMSMTNVSSIPNSQRKKLEFTYDSMGKRATKSVSTWNGSGFSGAVTTKFIYDGCNLLAEVDASSNLLRSYLWGQDLSGTMTDAGGVGGLLLVVDHVPATDTYHFPGYDGNGNLMELVNASDQTISARYEYSPFGEALRATGPLAKANPFRFSTKFWDEDSGMVYYGRRYYSPVLGRWISRDPIEDAGGMNLLAFVNNDPIGWIDPTGESKWQKIRQAIDSILAALGIATDQPDLTIPIETTKTVEETFESKDKQKDTGDAGGKGKKKKAKIYIFKGDWNDAKPLRRSPRGRALMAIGAIGYITSGQAEADSASFADNTRDYMRHIQAGDQAMADLDAAMIWIDALNLFGNSGLAGAIWANLPE